ncbi:cytosine permease [Amycolatopsis jejuensis]|uniref:cytosine permease n=1 Tax=Amycolatopsis jejuensis TaxID=330084 RepID=UPI000523F65F|nr:cytosine permease [Amycolatopsis jejuensis]
MGKGTEAGFSLEEEFEREPVPEAQRKSLLSVAAVWFGFPLNLVPGIFGGVLAAMMGFRQALLAILIGSVVLFVYVGALSYLAGKTGWNFAMLAERVFGRVGYRIVAGFLATVVIGWFAFNSGATGSTIHETFGWNERLVTLVACLVFVGITVLGVRSLSVLGMLAAPLFVVAVCVTLALAMRGVSGTDIWNYPGAGGGTMSLGAGATLVIATFADSGTMTADFTRWSKNGRHALLATATAFPFANICAFVAGAVVVSCGVIGNPAVTGGNFVPVMAHGHGALVTILALVFVLVSLGSVCAHCLYNGALGWSNLVGRKMRTLCLVLGAVATVAAVAGVWSHFVDWLNLLGVFVPPIGAVMIIATLWAAKRRETVSSAIAFAAYAIGAIAAGLVHYLAPEAGETVVGMVAAALAYAGLAAVTTARVPAELSTMEEAR